MEIAPNNMNLLCGILNQINNKRLFKSIDLSLNIIISIKFQKYQLYNMFFQILLLL